MGELQPDQVVVGLIGGVYVDHHVADVGVELEDAPLHLGGDLVGTFDGHLRVHVELQVDDEELPGVPGADLVHPVDPLDLAGECGQCADQFLLGEAVHQLVGRGAEAVIADVEDEEGGKAGCDRVHDPDAEVGKGDADQRGDGGNGVLAVVLGDRQQRRAAEISAHLHRIAVERLLDPDRCRGGEDGDQGRGRIDSGDHGGQGAVENPGAGRADDKRDQNGREAFHLAVAVGVILVVGLAPHPERDEGHADGDEVAGTLQAVREDRLGMAVVPGGKFHHHEDRVDPEAYLDDAFSLVEALSPMQPYSSRRRSLTRSCSELFPL
jgi:hypothetical protein